MKSQTKKTTKLDVKKSTLRNLSEADLKNTLGGAPPTSYCATGSITTTSSRGSQTLIG